jgi:hypothetical protein
MHKDINQNKVLLAIEVDEGHAEEVGEHELAVDLSFHKLHRKDLVVAVELIRDAADNFVHRYALEVAQRGKQQTSDYVVMEALEHRRNVESHRVEEDQQEHQQIYAYE